MPTRRSQGKIFVLVADHQRRLDRLDLHQVRPSMRSICRPPAASKLGHTSTSRRAALCGPFFFWKSANVPSHCASIHCLAAAGTRAADLAGLRAGPARRRSCLTISATCPPWAPPARSIHWPTFWRYITSGTADPTGRPLTLLTFLLDARDWPADPYPFKRTNLILHLVNGVLLALLLRRLGRDASARRSRAHRSGRCARRWLLVAASTACLHHAVHRAARGDAARHVHPAGPAGLAARSQRACARRMRRGLAWIVLGLGGCTALGVLSKANGILLRRWRWWWSTSFCAPASLARSAHCAPTSNTATQLSRSMWLIRMVANGSGGRLPAEAGWSGLARGISRYARGRLDQRLLTEPRVLLDYLDLLWLPRPFTPGLFNDQIQPRPRCGRPQARCPRCWPCWPDRGRLAASTPMASAWALAHPVLFRRASRSSPARYRWSCTSSIATICRRC